MTSLSTKISNFAVVNLTPHYAHFEFRHWVITVNKDILTYTFITWRIATQIGLAAIGLGVDNSFQVIVCYVEWT